MVGPHWLTASICGTEMQPPIHTIISGINSISTGPLRCVGNFCVLQPDYNQLLLSAVFEM